MWRGVYALKMGAIIIMGWSLVTTALADTHYVWADSPTPLRPYTSWNTASHTLQYAIDAAVSNDTVLVTNGVYATGTHKTPGGSLANRAVITRRILVKSVNGPEVTVIEGQGPCGPGAVRCIYIRAGILDGFTLANGCTMTNGAISDKCGGGAFAQDGTLNQCILKGNCASNAGGAVAYGTMNNCMLTGNSAFQGGATYESTLNYCILAGNSASDSGGGVFRGTLNNCTLSNNVANQLGGGAMYGTLNNCALTNNSAFVGGGTYECTLDSCKLTGNEASNSGGAVYGGTLKNCLLAGNSAEGGGGASSATLSNCVLTRNTASSGGGIARGTLTSCTIAENSAQYGGGAISATLSDCTLIRNTATGEGGGAAYGTLNSCTLADNCAYSGGGAASATLNNCLVIRNGASYWGGGVCDGSLSNCTLAGNSAPFGGGTYGTRVCNCIVYYNTATIASNNISGGAAVFTCTMPDPGGMGNTASEPRFVDTNNWADLRLALNSPCIDAGTNHVWMIGGKDFAGNPRISPYGGCVDMGAYESSFAQVATHYVWINSPDPLPPYLTWNHAAHTIQEAVDVAMNGDTVLVTNGLYSTGARVGPEYAYQLNRVLITNSIVVKSVNGPSVTIIKGEAPTAGGQVRCAYVTNGTLEGFTLTNGFALLAPDGQYKGKGGGAYAPGGTLNRCTITGNSAYSGGGVSDGYGNQCTLTGNSASNGGGGSFCATLNNCLLTGNSARGPGGGAQNSILNNCTVAGNSSAYSGGGTYGSTLSNCIVYYNTRTASPDNIVGSTVAFTCTTPDPGGTGNIISVPCFLTVDGWRDLRLAPGSPCINRGINQSWMNSATDLDGKPRIIGGVVDMGAYEK